MMLIARCQYRQVLLDRWGSNDKTQVEIDLFLTEIMGTVNGVPVEDFVDLAFGVWKKKHDLKDRVGA